MSFHWLVRHSHGISMVVYVVFGINTILTKGIVKFPIVSYYLLHLYYLSTKPSFQFIEMNIKVKNLQLLIPIWKWHFKWFISFIYNDLLTNRIFSILNSWYCISMRGFKIYLYTFISSSDCFRVSSLYTCSGVMFYTFMCNKNDAHLCKSSPVNSGLSNL